jgi:RimJ/RimL family protein N-acetyltransferase
MLAQPHHLTPAQLERSRTLPLQPASIRTQGQYIHLEPLDPFRHAASLFAVSNGSAINWGSRTFAAYDPDRLIWSYMPQGPFDTLEQFCEYLMQRTKLPNERPFCVLDTNTGCPAGVISIMSNAPAHLKAELGGIWYSPIVQRTGANLEAAYLLLGYLFDTGYRRVEWKCDAANVRSRQAALRIGFAFEGIQEFHMIVKGHSRDTAWFRMLDHEWPACRTALHARLYPE